MEKLLDANDHPTVSTTNSKPKQLLSQSTLPQHGWKGEAVQDIKARLESDAGFPCVFSKNAFKKGLILFHFVESACPADIALLAKALREYVEISKNWDGTLATSYSKDVQRFKADKKADILGYVKKLNRRGDSVLVQPYLNSIDLVGETDLIFFNGQYSHAIRKGALLAADGTVNVPTSDFRQEHEPDETEITVASKALKVTADRFGLRHPLLYARVDLIRDIKGDPVVLEMELAEPSLSLPNCRGSATRFAYALNEMCREDELASVS